MLVRGKGCRVWDQDGKEYLDFVAGLATCVLGHSHEGLARAIARQANTLLHVSNLYFIEPQIELARLLSENSFADRVFFCNSGAEANEGAIKLARKYFHDRDQRDRFHIITMDRSFHGRTLATLAATGQTKYRSGFDPPVQGFSHVPFGDLRTLESAISHTTAAIMLEPIQGEGGVWPAPPDYLQGVRDLCDRTGCLMILDEVQTGMGRTGRLFAYEHAGIEPDIMTLAKGLAGGVPIGGLLADEGVAAGFTPGTHAATFGGNPLSSAAGVAVLEELLAPGFLETVRDTGNYLRACLEDMARRRPIIREVRGLGLMQAIDLKVQCADLSSSLRTHGFLVNCTADTVLRFIPPLIITRAEIDALIEVLDGLLEDMGEEDS